MAQSHSQCCPMALSRVPEAAGVPPFMDRIRLGNVWAAIVSCFFVFHPQLVFVGQIWAHLGLVCFPRRPESQF